MSLLATHTEIPATHQRLYGRTLTLRSHKTDDEVEIVAIWNDISALAGMRGVPEIEVDKASIVINKKIELDNNLTVTAGWFVVGTPNDQEANKTYVIDEIKEGHQHQVKICFLKLIKPNTWDNEI